MRVSLFGGGTDYPEVISNLGTGGVIGGAIDKYVYLMQKPIYFQNSGDRTILVVHYSKVERVSTIEELQFTPIRLAVTELGLATGQEYYIHSDLPIRSGLGTSSAFAVSMLKLLDYQNGQVTNPIDLSKNSFNFERNILSTMVGQQDQYLSAHGSFNKIIWQNNGEVELSKFSEDVRKTLSKWLLLVNTGIQRNASEIAQKQIENHDSNISYYQSIFEIMLKGEESVLRLDMDKISRYLNATWEAKKELLARDEKYFFTEIENEILRSGGLGLKLLGAGGGGFFLVLVDPVFQKRFKDSIGAHRVIDFEFIDEIMEPTII